MYIRLHSHQYWDCVVSLTDKKYRESHKKYYRDYMSVYNEHHLGSKSTEKIYTSKDLRTDSEL